MHHFDTKKSDSAQCDLTPIIDIVFLLIIFFMIVCTFISAENLEVQLPDEIESAENARIDPPKSVALTAMLEDGSIVYAVGATRVEAEEGELIGAITESLNEQLAKLGENERLVDLRIDKDVPYSQCQHLLAAISRSSASKINIAVTKEKRLR